MSSDGDDSGNGGFLRWLFDPDDWRWNSGHAFISVMLTISVFQAGSVLTAALPVALSVASWLWLLQRYRKSRHESG